MRRIVCLIITLFISLVMPNLTFAASLDEMQNADSSFEAESNNSIQEARDEQSNYLLNTSASDESVTKYLLRPENFPFPDPRGGWIRDGNETIVDPIPGPILRSQYASTDLPVTAEVYLSNDSVYSIWALSRDYANSSPGTRWFTIGIDGTYNTYRFGSTGVDGWSWNRGFSVNLSAGWHTVKIKPGGSHMRVAAVMITNDSSLVLDNATNIAHSTALAPWEDKIAPTLNGSITVRSVGFSSINIAWPEASDNKKIVCYRLSINNNMPILVDPTQTSIEVSGYFALDTLNIKVEALDALGNKAVLSKQTKLSPYVVSAFNITDSTLTSVSNLLSLAAGGKAFAKVTVKNDTTDERPIVLGIAVYDKQTGRMMVSKRISRNLGASESITDFNVDIVLPSDFAILPSKYSVYAALWDSNQNIEPLFEGILIDN